MLQVEAPSIFVPKLGVTRRVDPSRGEIAEFLATLPFRRWKPSAEMIARNDKDFLERFARAEIIKTRMRAAYAKAQLRGYVQDDEPGRAVIADDERAGLVLRGIERREAFLSRSLAFWQEYEAVNRELLPDDPVYSITLSGVTASTAAIWAEYKPAAAGQARILESYFGGEQTSSTVERIGCFIATTAGVTPTAYTPNKLNSRSAAAAGTGATAYTTQPVLPTNPIFLHAFNAFGGTDRWVPQPGEEGYVLGAGTVGEPADWQPKAGASVMSSHAMVEEL